MQLLQSIPAEVVDDHIIPYLSCCDEDNLSKVLNFESKKSVPFGSRGWRVASSAPDTI